MSHTDLHETETRRCFLFLFAFVFYLSSSVTALAQPTAASERAVEWSRHAIPQSEFIRIIDEPNGVVFRAPAGWQRQAVSPLTEQHSTFRFTGPHTSLLQISLEKIPDGLPLSSYVAAVLQQLRNLPGSTGLVVRRTEMSGLEAREIMFEVPDEKAELSRRVIWCTVSGPVAAAVLLIEPTQHTTELEPYLRAVVQTLTISEKEKLSAYEQLRATAIKDPKPIRIDEAESLVSRADGLDANDRDSVVTKLAALCVTAPELAIDLLLDRRPIVRSTVVEGIARSNNRVLDPFLIKALHDPEPIVAEQAGRAVAAMPNVIATLRDETLDWMSTGLLARAWPFLDKKLQLQILNEAFGEPPPLNTKTPATRARARQSATYAHDMSTQLGLLSLAVDLPLQDFKLPLAAILKSNNNVLTTTALQISYARGEKLPVTELLKLLASGSPEVRCQAAINLGESATPANVVQIEAAAKQAAPTQNPNLDAKSPIDSSKGQSIAEQLHATIKKIQFRERVSPANGEQRQQIIKSGLADPQIADWVWLRFVSDENQSPPPASGAATRQLSLGDTVFPGEVIHFVTVPKPAELVRKVGESLNSIQMDSARTQANLVLVMAGVRAQLGAQFNTPVDGSILDYSGLNTNTPISFGSWNARSAPVGVPGARRKAIVLHVTDRGRFERTLALYQEKIGSVAMLPEGVAVGARFLAAMPALLPLSAQALLQDQPRKKSETPILKYTLLGQTDVDSYPVKYFAQREISEKGILTNDVAYLLYAGDAVLLTPDLASLRDALQRIRNGAAALAQSEQYKQAIAGGGDAIYFSNFAELLAESDAKSESQMREQGALRISNSLWESSYQLISDDSDASKFVYKFQPDQLLAPHDLLPRSTVLYYFMKINATEALREFNRLATLEHQKQMAGLWSLDFEKDVLPEVDQECGAAMLALPDVAAADLSVPWIVFFRLKGPRLQQALNDGRLFKEGSTNKGVARINFGGSELYASVANGFLVFADAPGTFDRLNQPEKLATSPDFAKAIKRTPGGIVAFGGYNFEATSPQVSASDAVQTQTANMLLSLARAFHSPSLYAMIDSGKVEARSSISLDREGRYSVAELQALAATSEPAFAMLQPGGIPISNQNRLKHLRLRMRAKAAGAAERIAEDVSSISQTVEKKTDQELAILVLPRRSESPAKIQLPITQSEFAPYLKPTADIRSDDKSVIDKAREIAGSDHDAWSVARKLADWTHENLTWKVVDYADAAQTLATREADCYEFSKLYVAMARSLGLPARVVSGMAYSGSSFGGHAWVEVYAGSWLELDPTWGTNFVDATHIKTSNGALLSYAALDLVQLEVLEASRGVPDFQLDAAALTRTLCEELPNGNLEALESALDISVITDELMGPGTWASMSDEERDQISASYRRVVNAIARDFRKSSPTNGGLRLLKIKQTGDRAEAWLMRSAYFGDLVIKLSLVRRAEGWMLREILELDTGLRVLSENLEPAIQQIRSRRLGKQSAMFQSGFARLLMTIDQNPQAAVEMADRLLKENPKDASLRYLKSLALLTNEKSNEAVAIWIELSEERPPFAQALRKLAEHYEISKEESDHKKALDLYTQYLSLEPDDPRTHVALANLYELAADFTRAETEYRAAIEGDSSNSNLFVDLAAFYATRHRFTDAVAVLDDALKRAAEKDDLFGDLLSRFLLSEETDVPEGLAASQPQRVAQSARANLVLARIRMNHQRPREALPLLKRAAALDAKSSEAYDLISEAHRTLHQWPLALAAADTAISLNTEDADGHYERACSFARLGRAREAMAELKRALELDEDLQYSLEEEDDLKPLSTLPEFKKLLPKPEQP